MEFLLPNFTDIIDILIVWAIIYRLILLAKREGGYQILIGLSVLLFLFIIASFLQLEMILSVISTLKDHWLLVVIILFQPEIRNILAKMSHTNIFAPFQKTPVKSIYAPLTNAIDTMSFLKRGSLIVIENKIKLNKFIETGEKIDAILSSRLLNVLFDKNSSLHDGAMIIRNDRIIAAKVVLPLSQNLEYKRHFGTRHLAAVGISEESDALAIVVSEETGKIAVALKGELQVDVNLERLSQIISDSTK
ncbi:MAG: diadenylate cyclase CdaA [Candidatus Cloacimonas sp.]|nr:diadenylate cyclase CdaA [Candidatus Cloacimonadota bacterium]